jgi:polar amino acid transport system substrate-binding protein
MSTGHSILSYAFTILGILVIDLVEVNSISMYSRLTPLVYLALLSLVTPTAQLTAQTSSIETNHLTIYVGFIDPESLLARRVIKEVMAQLGYRVTYQQELFRRSIVHANQYGDAELLRVESISEIDPSITDNLIRVPVPTIFTTVRVVSNKQELSISALSDLIPHRNGVEYGVRYLEANVPSIVSRDTITRLEALILQGQLDTIAYVSLIARRKQGLTEVYTERLPVHTYMHRKHKDLVPLIADKLRMLRISGRYQEIKRNIVEHYLVAP